MALLSSTICIRLMLCVCVRNAHRTSGFFDAEYVYLDQYLFLIFANGPGRTVHCTISIHFLYFGFIAWKTIQHYSQYNSLSISLALQCYQLLCWRFTRFNYFWVWFFCSFRAIFPLALLLLSELEINYCFNRSCIQWTGFWYLIDFIMHFFPCLCIVNRNFSLFSSI